jgi:enoyl-CoA hydratase
MGITQGASHRVVTEHSKLAMPETHIGLFPDVGGGWFLSRCAGRLGEYLALTGHVLKAADAIETGLADIELPSATLPAVIDALAALPWLTMQSIADTLRQHASPQPATAPIAAQRALIDQHFAGADLHAIEQSLQADNSDWAQATLPRCWQSPLMAVTLEQIRRARHEPDRRPAPGRDLVRHYPPRPGAASETVEGIRAGGRQGPRAAVEPAAGGRGDGAMVEAFFASPWPAHAHPLASLH